MRQIRKLTEREKEIDLLRELVPADKVAVDIGANRGLYVYHLLKITPRVVAFEPLPAMRKVLQRQYGRDLVLHGVALSDHEGEATIRMPSGNHSWATLAPTNTLGMANVSKGFVELKVPVTKLDKFELQNVGFMKIDVEGYEEVVLSGARSTIRRDMPNLLIEVEERHNPGSVRRVMQFLESYGYLAYFLSEGKIHSFSEFDVSRDQRTENVGEAGKIGRYINNFILISRDKPPLI